VALTDNLVSFWSLDEASGNALDAHGSNTLTETSGTIASATGKVSGARDFEAGDTEHFEIADNASLSTGDIDYTIAAWVQLESLATGTIAAKFGTTGNQREWRFYYDATASRFRLSVSPTGASAGTVTASADTFGVPSTGTWYHVVAWHDSVNNLVGISVNGGTADTTAHATGSINGTAAFTVGVRLDPAADYWDGLIDEVGFWKRVLTSSERTELYNAGNGLAYPFGGVVTVVPHLALLGVGS
jgi:hypothetical protein